MKKNLKNVIISVPQYSLNNYFDLRWGLGYPIIFTVGAKLPNQ